MDNIFLINSLRKGGAERQAAFFLKNFPEFQAITLEPGNEYNINSERFLHPPSKKINKIFQALVTIVKLIEIKPKQVLSFLEFSNYINIIASFFTKHKTIISIRTSITFHKGLRGKINLLLIKLLYQYADIITFNSSESLDLLKNFLNLDSSKLKVIPNAIADNIFRKDKYIPPTDFIRLIVVGRLEVVKNFEAAIRITSELKKTIRCQLVIVGEGSEKTNLKNLCTELGLNFSQSRDLDFNSSCIFTGQVNNPEYFLKQSHLFLLTSKTEGLPNTLLEAMANKIPCLSSNCKTGPSEILIDSPSLLLEIPVNQEIIDCWVKKISSLYFENNFAYVSDKVYSIATRYHEKDIFIKWQNLIALSKSSS